MTRAEDRRGGVPRASDAVFHETLGAQMVGDGRAEVSKRIDVFATALFSEMTVERLNDVDLSYTPPLSTPWDALQVAAQAWTRDSEKDG